MSAWRSGPGHGREPGGARTSRACSRTSRALAARPTALAYLETCPPSYRKLVLYWIADAKRPETRARRIADLVARSARGERRF